MGIIICQQCREVSYYEEEKVTKLYGVCNNCNKKHKK